MLYIKNKDKIKFHLHLDILHKKIPAADSFAESRHRYSKYV